MIAGHAFASAAMFVCINAIADDQIDLETRRAADRTILKGCARQAEGLSGDLRRSFLRRCIDNARREAGQPVPASASATAAATARVPELDPWDVQADFRTESRAGILSPDRLIRVSVADLYGKSIAVSLQISEGEPECQGFMFGLGELNEGKASLVPYPALTDRNEDACRVTMTFATGGKRHEVSETDACGYFHGGRCSFSGDYVRDGKVSR